MSEKSNAKCSICGTRYHICNDCNNAVSFTPWRTIACSINCYKIFLAINDYTNGRSSKSETKSILYNCDLSEMDSFEKNIKDAIVTILQDDVVRGAKKRTQNKANMDIMENNTV